MDIQTLTDIRNDLIEILKEMKITQGKTVADYKKQTSGIIKLIQRIIDETEDKVKTTFKYTMSQKEEAEWEALNAILEE